MPSISDNTKSKFENYKCVNDMYHFISLNIKHIYKCNDNSLCWN